jgi:lysozyme family protein
MTAWSRTFAFLLRWEGDYSDHPNDPGERTLFGIAEAFYPGDFARAYACWQAGDRAGARARAEQFFYREFWLTVRGPDLRWPLCLAVFDCAVNLGVGTAGKLLQAAANALTGAQPRDSWYLRQDGVIGPKTLRTTRACDPQALTMQVCGRRLKYYAGREQARRDVFLPGWVNRVAALLQEASFPMPE